MWLYFKWNFQLNRAQIIREMMYLSAFFIVFFMLFIIDGVHQLTTTMLLYYILLLVISPVFSTLGLRARDSLCRDLLLPCTALEKYVVRLVQSTLTVAVFFAALYALLEMTRFTISYLHQPEFAQSGFEVLVSIKPEASSRLIINVSLVMWLLHALLIPLSYKLKKQGILAVFFCLMLFAMLQFPHILTDEYITRSSVRYTCLVGIPLFYYLGYRYYAKIQLRNSKYLIG